MVKVVERIEEANCITHNGTMHADEIFATAFLELYLKNVKVFRTSNIDFHRVANNAIIYDIGRGEFDHHQPDALKRDNGITYSSFGLLWKKYGGDFLIQKKIYNVEEVFNEFDKDFVEAIDAEDNGFFPKIEANYKVKTISGLFKIFNPSYKSHENESIQFQKAVEIAYKILEEELVYVEGKVLANKKTTELIDYLEPNIPYMILDEYLPYEEALLTSEKAKSVLFVAFPSNRGGYAIKTVPKSIEDRTARLEFPEEWGGLTDSELEEVSGIKGLRFCHKGRFIVSCNDIEAVMQVFQKLCFNQE